MRGNNMGRPVTNKYGVPAREWAKWSNAARKAFNRMYYAMRPSCQPLLVHPGMPLMSRRHWQTLRWNTAWTAADIVTILCNPAPRKKA